MFCPDISLLRRAGDDLHCCPSQQVRSLTFHGDNNKETGDARVMKAPMSGVLSRMD